MKKLTAFLLAVLLLLLCGCQNNSLNTGKQPTAGSLAAKFENIHYRSEYHTVSGTACMNCYCAANDKIYYCYYPDGVNSDTSAKIYFCNYDGSDEQYFEMPYTSEEYFDEEEIAFQSVNGMYKGEDCLYILEFVQTQSPDFINFYAYSFLHTVDFSGNELSVIDITDLLMPAGIDSFYDIQELFISADGDIYMLKTSFGLDVFTADGTKKLSLGSEIGFGNLIPLFDGSVLVENNGKIHAINFENQRLDEQCSLTSVLYNKFYCGVEDFDFTYSNGASLFGVNIKSGEEVQLLTFINCGVDSSDMVNTVPTEDGMLIIHNDMENKNWGISVLNRYEGESGDDKTVLTLACATVELDSGVSRAIVKFNQMSTDYRIEIKDYSKYDTAEDNTGGLSVLTTEILSGKTPDMFITTGIDIDSYAARGILEDLWPYIDSDTALGGRDALILPVFNAISSKNGALYQIASGFAISTFIANKELVSDGSNLSTENIKKIVSGQNEEFTVFGDYSRTNAKYFSAYHALDDYVDWETKSCSFDSPEFKDLLTFIMDNFSADGYPSMGTYTYYTNVADKKQLLAQANIYSFNDMQILNSIFKGNGVFVGWPGSKSGVAAFDVYGGLAMCSACEHKDAVWEFMRIILTEENQLSGTSNYTTFPTNKSAFEIGLEKAKFAGYVTDENGETVLDVNGNPILQTHGSVMIQSSDGSAMTFVIDNMTDEQAETLMSLINDTEKLSDYDANIFDIFVDELNSLFEGKQDIDKTAKAIQSRVEIYVSEQG